MKNSMAQFQDRYDSSTNPHFTYPNQQRVYVYVYHFIITAISALRSSLGIDLGQSYRIILILELSHVIFQQPEICVLFSSF